MKDETPIPTTMTLKLSRKVVSHSGSKWDSLSLRQPIVSEWREALKHDGADVGINLLSKISKMEVDAINRLPISDYRKAMAYVDRFLKGAIPDRPADTGSEWTYKLSQPVNDEDGKQIAEVTIHEPTVSDWKKSGKVADQVLSDIMLLTLASNLDSKAVDAMTLADYRQATDYLMSFFT